ncbi:diacylglycerol/lipid kinase family protein [Lacticaseibacillus yichunensis]|uniref:Diacylglycerol/lipid kinase family protein n=1 Tax=Lacticaseibacillus yichunensis TaxID=2486015 RepID=A0ABW4CN08_9LACO|nr:YegS/Rv2252/BmrU family lipid kinase [Lacticaseibacillus yichunensis]
MSSAELIINEHAGNAREKDALPALIKTVATVFSPVHENHTQAAGDARTIAAQLVGQYADRLDELTIIVIGGDGTLHDVVNGLQQTGHPEVAIGYIPTGTGDDFARANHIPLKSQEAANALVHAVAKPIRIGQITSREYGQQWFINNFGIGIDALVVYATNHSGSKNLLNALKLGSLSYPLHFATALAKQKPFTSTWTNARGAHHSDRSYLCVFTNHPFLGGGIRLIMPEADDRTNLHLVIVERERWQVLAKVLLGILRHQPNDPAIHHYVSPQFEFSTEANEHIQVDGEELSTPLHATLTQTTQLFLLP